MKPEIGSVSPSKKRQPVHDQATVSTSEPGNRNATSPRMGSGGRGSDHHPLETQLTTRLVFRPNNSTPVQHESLSGSLDAGSTAESEGAISDLSVATGMATPAAPVTPITPIDSGYATPFSPFSAYASTQPSVQSVMRDGSSPAQSPLANSLPSVAGARRLQWNAGSPYQNRGRSNHSGNAGSSSNSSNGSNSSNSSNGSNSSNSSNGSNSSNSSNSSSNSNSNNSPNTVTQHKEKRSRSPVKALLDKAKRRLSVPTRKASAERTHGKLPPSPAPATQSNSPLSPEFQYKQMARNLEEGSDSSSIGSPTPQSPPPRGGLAGGRTQDGQGADSIERVRRYTAPTESPSKPASASHGYVNPTLIFSQCEVLISTLMNSASLQAKSVALAQAVENFVSELTLEHPNGGQLHAAFCAFQSTLLAQSGAALQRNAVARGLLSQLEEAIQHIPVASPTSPDLFSPGYRLHLKQSAKDFGVWARQ